MINRATWVVACCLTVLAMSSCSRNPVIGQWEVDTEQSDPLAAAGQALAASDAAVLVVAQRVSTIVDADQILVLEDGSIVERGPIMRIFKHPAHPYTIGLLGSLPGLDVIGIDVHIGSQLTELEPYRLAYQKVAELTETLRADGHDIRRLDLGETLVPVAGLLHVVSLLGEAGQLTYRH